MMDDMGTSVVDSGTPQAGRATERDLRTISSIGIIGAGQMGHGIAHVCALAGYRVVLNDLDAERVEKAISIIDRNLTRQVAKKRISEEDRAESLARLSYGPTYDELGDVDLVIEAATEDETVKRKIFTELCSHLSSDALLATNTS